MSLKLCCGWHKTFDMSIIIFLLDIFKRTRKEVPPKANGLMMETPRFRFLFHNSFFVFMNKFVLRYMIILTCQSLNRKLIWFTFNEQFQVKVGIYKFLEQIINYFCNGWIFQLVGKTSKRYLLIKVRISISSRRLSNEQNNWPNMAYVLQCMV